MTAFKVPYSFVADTKAKAEEVEGNFEALENEINDNLRPGRDEPGDLKITARAAAPDGWLMCEGQAVSRATYSALFAAIGTTYGKGDGATTFNIPDLRGRVPVGVDGAAGRLSENDTLGASGGHKNMPAHSHASGTLATAGSGTGISVNGVGDHNHTTTGQYNFTRTGGSGGLAPAGAGTESFGTGPAGGHTHSINDPGHSHGVTGATANEGTGPSGGDDRMQPFLIVNYLVKT